MYALGGLFDILLMTSCQSASHDCHNNDYISIFIDCKKRLVQTMNLLLHVPPAGLKVITLMRIWIAKSMPIIDFYFLNNNNKMEVSFGSEDMNSCDYFLESELMNLPSTNTHKNMYFHKIIINMKDIPVQRDGINCGVYSLWYLILECYDREDFISLDVERF